MPRSPFSLGVLTSGGDAPGMNAAVRAVTRSALDLGAAVYAIHEGFQGLVDGGERIRSLDWEDVGGILQQGGTAIGSARSDDFRRREGRRRAAGNLLVHGIDRLVVIGGDGSLTGANLFHQEWPELLAELVAAGALAAAEAEAHPRLTVVGLVGSIDNDMFGTDMTIGADTALHRITGAIDAITSTAASHQRTFVVEVMGRNCGYLALMSALATGADWVLIPERPPAAGDWEAAMCDALSAARQAGRRASIVVVAEGACDRDGQPISSERVKRALETRLRQDVRVTILGHVQRGGAPSAFDRYMSTLLGHAAAVECLDGGEPCVIGMRENRITQSPLLDSVAQTHAVAEHLKARQYEQAMALRGGSFSEAHRTFWTLVQASPAAAADRPGRRLAILTPGAPAPGMNTAVRVAVRLGLDRGHTMLGVSNGFQGLGRGQIEPLAWMRVSGWAGRGGSELGTNRSVPEGGDFYAIARAIEEHRIDGLLVIGGWNAYEGAHRLQAARANFPAFRLPIVCLPASINNNLPGSEMSVGADTALNSIVDVVDKIKQSAVASRRVFVVEVMGRRCGYLALMSGLATGAERVYLHEEGVTLGAMQEDLASLLAGFERGKRVGLVIRSESANPIYTTGFMCALFEEEGGDAFEVRQAILGHLQQGGSPSPFDRIQASRLASRCVEFLEEQAGTDEPLCAFIGLQNGKVRLHPLEDLPRMADGAHQRPKAQWWLDLRPIARIMAKPAPG